MDSSAMIVNVLSVGIGGLIGSFFTSFYMFKRKEKEELRQKVYEPLRQELEFNLNKIWRADLGFAFKEWQRIHNQEYWSFKIKPEKLRKRLMETYETDFHNHRLYTRSSKEKILGILKNNLKIKNYTTQEETILWYIIEDLITYENNLNRYKVGSYFDELIKNHKLKYENYESFRKEMINILKEETLLKDYWEKRKEFANKVSYALKDLEKNLGIKKKNKLF